VVAQKGTADLSFSSISEEDWHAVEQEPGVELANGVLLYFTSKGSNPFFSVFGMEPTLLEEVAPPLREGHLLDEGESEQVLLGSRAADDLDAGLGDVVEIAGTTLVVVGIYHSGELFQDGGAYIPLATAQEMAAKPDQVSLVNVRVQPGVDPSELEQRLEDEFPNLTVVSSVSEYGDVDQGIVALDAANIAISALAIVIGGIGVMNTMIMSVFERTREIGILRAVGWSGSRVLRMILAESLVLCALGAGLGSLLGVLATQAVLISDTVSSFLDPKYTAQIFVRGMVVAFIVAVIGAAYPIYRALRFTPMEALRYE
jgi:putative ABC transport system permease protein